MNKEPSNGGSEGRNILYSTLNKLQTPMPVRFYHSIFEYLSYFVRYTLWERRGMLVLQSVPPLVRKFQMDQVTVGAGMNPTRRTVSKSVVHWSIFCTRSRASTASAHHNFMFLCFSVDVHDCLVRLDGQSVRDGLAAVKLSWSSFRQFFFRTYNVNIHTFHKTSHCMYNASVCKIWKM